MALQAIALHRYVPDVTAPSVSSFSPADNATGVAVGANLVITFTETVIAQASKNIVIKKTSDNTTVATIAANNTGLVTVSTNTVTINPASDLDAGTGYYVQIDSGAFKDGAGNDFAGISNTTDWSFATASASVTSDASVVLDARTLSYANDTPIDNASAKWTDTSTAGTNHGIQATSNQRPLVKTNASESGSARVIRFAVDAQPDNVELTTPVSLTGAFTLAMKFKAGTRDGGLLTNADVTSYVTGILAMNGSISATSDGDAVDSASVVTGGKYHSAPTGVFYNDGVAGNATFTTTIDGSGALTGVTIEGTNTGYNGTVTAVFDQLGWAQFATHDGSVVSGPTAGNLADGNFHNLIVTRNASNLVRWELDGVEVGTDTHAGTLSAGQIGTYLSGDIEAFVLWTADKTADLAAIRTFLG